MLNDRCTCWLEDEYGSEVRDDNSNYERGLMIVSEEDLDNHMAHTFDNMHHKYFLPTVCHGGGGTCECTWQNLYKSIHHRTSKLASVSDLTAFRGANNMYPVAHNLDNNYLDVRVNVYEEKRRLSQLAQQ